jgi:hypothetical protein
MPSHRLKQPNNEISYITPDNWYVGKLPGSDSLACYTELDYGIHPNIRIEIISTEPFSIESFISNNRSSYNSFAVLKENEFKTSKGVVGKKVEVRRLNIQKIPISHFYYFFQYNNKSCVITATCPEDTVRNYRFLFDQSLKTIEFG